MVPTKKRSAKTKTESRQSQTPRQSKTATENSAVVGGDPLRFNDYLLMNGVFIAFCVVQLIVVRILLRDFAGLYFFFGFLICAFAIASAFDYLSEKLRMGISAGEPAEPAND